jgi:hypothetical protein
MDPMLAGKSVGEPIKGRDPIIPEKVENRVDAPWEYYAERRSMKARWFNMSEPIESGMKITCGS